jgi:hypothetical protein
LLLKAIRNLPEREQDTILGYLLERSVLPGGEAFDPRGLPHPTVPAMAAAQTAPPPALVYSGTGEAGTLRTMPIRFPEPLYQRLKEWCSEHNFPMAVVVRGLVERFLDEQQQRAA